MALLIGDNFNYQGQKPNFERDSFDTLESMISYPETSIDDGHISYCKETKKHYIYNSSNESTNTGKWKELSNSSNGSGIVNVNDLSEDVQTFFNEAFVLTTGGTMSTYSQMLEYLKSNGNQIYWYVFDESASAYSYGLAVCKEDGTIIVTTDPIFHASEDNYTTSRMYVLIGTTGIIQDKKIRSSSLSISDSGDLSILLNTANGEDVKQTPVIFNVSGDGTKFLADNGQYKAIDASSSSIILPFEQAPEVLQNFIRDGLSHPGKTYTIDYADDLFSALTSLDGTVYLDSKNDAGILYIYVQYTSKKCGVVLDAPIYSGYHHLRAQIVADTSGNLESSSIANAQVAEENKIQLSCATNGVGTSISLDTAGDGTKYLGDDGNYHEVKQISSYGTTAERPSNVSIGFQYFDTDLNRPIWWNGTEWVGATDANIVKLTQAQYEELPTKDPDTIYFIKG